MPQVNEKLGETMLRTFSSSLAQNPSQPSQSRRVLNSLVI
eukprot:COSAG02_NODE_23444_length_718_cov_2.408724_1_plen_39_part_01